MAKQVVSIKVCDRDAFGKEKPATEIRQFSIGSDFYKLELCEQHATLFDREIGGWALIAQDDEYAPRVRMPKIGGVFTAAQTEAARKAAALRAEQQQLDADVEQLAQAAQAAVEEPEVAEVHRLSYGAQEWVLTPHAQERAKQRGYSLNEVLEAAEHPERAYDQLASKYGPGTRLHRRGECMVAVNPTRKVVISVLHYDPTKYALDPQPQQAVRMAQ